MTNSIGLVLLLVFSTALLGCSGSENAGNTNVAVTNEGNQNVRVTNEGNQNVSATNEAKANVSAKNEYPEKVIDEFIKSCESAGSDRTFCGCVLDKVQGKYTFEEFSVIESKMSAGEAQDEFVEFTESARAECKK